jgi:hypothetical protein
VSAIQNVCRDVSDRCDEESFDCLRVRQQHLHLLLQRVIGPAGGGHKSGPLARIAVERGITHFFDAPPALSVGHRVSPSDVRADSTPGQRASKVNPNVDVIGT